MAPETTGFPNVPRRDLAWSAAVVSALLSMIVYALTLIPEVGWGDSAEFALQASQLGVTHGPGYPVHTFLGKLFAEVLADPAFGTNLLSAVCTSISVGLFNLICFELTGSWYAGVVSGFIYALLPRIWEMAVVAEVYNVNVCVFALVLFLVILQRRRTSMLLLCASAIAFGVSLGAYLANLLLMPGLVYMAACRRSNWLSAGILFVSLASVVGAVVLSWSYFRVDDCTPLGTMYLPDSVPSFVSYLLGSQHGTTMVHPLGFYLGRIAEHARIFSGTFLWVGVLMGVWGIGCLWRRDWRTCLGLLAVVLADMAFFTSYMPFDYYTMVAPSYLVFALWIACCVAFAASRRRGVAVVATSVVLPIGLVVGLLATQWTSHRARSQQSPVTDFVLSSFKLFDPKALVIADWPEFPALLYFQKIHDFRQDLTLIERSEQPRHYTFGVVADWRSALYAASATRPVYASQCEDHLAECCYKVTRANPHWFSFERVPRQR